MWNDHFLTLFNHCLTIHASGDKNYTNYYTDEDRALLAAIGYKEREFYDFVEDLNDYHAPTASTALLIAAVRRDYFLTVQKGKSSNEIVTVEDLPTFGDTIADIAYLPRILCKARAKLRGALDPEIMYGCGGDRNFLETNGNIHPADFLRHVWAAGDDDEKIARYILSQKA